MVVTAGLGVEVMRWGFHRSFNPSVNNARSDKLAGGMWTAAFRERRCVIPMTHFYEWGPGIGGKEPAYEFGDPADDFLWVAGIWEEHPEFGRCYSMVTTDVSSLMAPIHERMPAILLPAEAPAYLNGPSWSFQSFAGPLTDTPCASQLVKPPGPDPQQELFRRHQRRQGDHGRLQPHFRMVTQTPADTNQPLVASGFAISTDLVVDNPQNFRHLDPPENLLDNAGSNPALPTILIINELGSPKGPFLLLVDNLFRQFLDAWMIAIDPL